VQSHSVKLKAKKEKISLCALRCSFACPVGSRRLSFGELCALRFALKLVLNFEHLNFEFV